MRSCRCASLCPAGHREVQVAVRAGLASDQRVDAPAAVDPCAYAERLDLVEHGQDLRCRHHGASVADYADKYR